MSVLVTGARGFVGARVMAAMDGAVPAPSLQGLTEDDIQRIVDMAAPDVILHTAAISDIPTCEKNPEASYHANVEIPLWLARTGVKLVAFSTDQVYNSSEEPGPYSEVMEKPANTYAKHKLEMENRVLDLAPDAVMLRAEWMYDWPPVKPNYLSYILRAEGFVAFSSRQFRGITWVREVADNMPAVLKLPGGAYNFGSETDLSIYGITREFADYLGLNLAIEDMPPGHNLWMDCSKAARHGVRFSTALQGLTRCALENSLITPQQGGKP